MAHKITTEMHHSVLDDYTTLLVKVAFDRSFYDELEKGEYSELADRIAQIIAEKIQPDIEKRIFDDPLFQENLMNRITVILANRLANAGVDKKVLESEHEAENAATENKPQLKRFTPLAQGGEE